MPSKLTGVAILGIVLAIGASAGCGGSSDDGGGTPSSASSLQQAAEKEGEVTFYSSIDDAGTNMIVDAFTEKYPNIEVHALRLSTGPLMTRFSGEYEAGVHDADIVDVAATSIFEQHPDWFMTLTPSVVPSLADWPAESLKGPYITALQASMGIVYNTKLVKGDLVPKTWTDLLKPEHKNHLILANPKSSPTYMNWYSLMLEKNGPDFLTGLKGQNPIYVEGGTEGTQQIATTGDKWIFASPPAAHIGDLQAKGAPVQIVFPAENDPSVPGIGPEHEFSIPAKAPHPNAARLFMDWISSQEGARVACVGDVASSPIVKGFKGCPDPPKGFQAASKVIPDDVQAQIVKLLGR